MKPESDERTQQALESLRRYPLFSDLPPEDLERLVQMARHVSIEPGQVLMEEGTPGGTLYVVLDGEFEVTKRSGSQDVRIAVRGVGEMFGEISIIDRAPRSATLTALKRSHLLEFGQEALQALLESSPAASLSLLKTVTSRLRSTESMLRQHEKMAALGTLAAGLAHELNNPAAAISRSAQQMGDLLRAWIELGLELSGQDMTPEEAESLKGLVGRDLSAVGSGEPLDPLALSDAEEAMQDWLSSLGSSRAWETSSRLVSAGWTAESLADALGALASNHRVSAAEWLAAGASGFQLVDELSLSAAQISAIVKSVKTYAYLDQAPIQRVSVHQGLEDTLVILRQKLGDGIRIVRNYDPSLPEIEGHGSELNQVWTNLIENAVDAMAGDGELTLTTRATQENVIVDICDTGPGIPEDIRDRIFEPFFTTKPPGVGTGLGLHIVYNIVCQKHGGSIHPITEGGRNCFRVEIPLEPRGRAS